MITVKNPKIYFEMLFHPQSRFQHFPIPFTWFTLSKNEVLSGNSLMRGVIPVTLFWRGPEDKVRYLSSAILSRSSDESGSTVLHIDRPCIFAEEGERTEIFKSMLDGITRVANLMNIDRIEVELYTEVKEPICFPSGSSYLDSWNAPDLPRLFTDNGFIAKEKRFCLACDLSERPFLRMKEVKTISAKDLQQYIRLNHRGIHMIKHSRKMLFGPKSLASRNMAFFSDPRLTLMAETKGFLHKGLRGVITWALNIYPYLQAFGVKAFYQDLDTIIRKSEIRTGKIFNIIVDNNHFDTYRKLCRGALEQMKALGLSTCQIGGISESEGALLSFLREEGFTEAQVTNIFSQPANQV